MEGWSFKHLEMVDWLTPANLASSLVVIIGVSCGRRLRGRALIFSDMFAASEPVVLRFDQSAKGALKNPTFAARMHANVKFLLTTQLC